MLLRISVYGALAMGILVHSDSSPLILESVADTAVKDFPVTWIHAWTNTKE